MHKPSSKYLYKYKPITDHDRNPEDCKGYTRRLLLFGEIYYSRFDELNDPNEVLVSYTEDVMIAVPKSQLSTTSYKRIDHYINDEQVAIIIDGKEAGKHLKKALEKRRGGMYCLTEDPKNLLLFDYYANGHRGICIGFDWKKFLMRRDGSDIGYPTKIQYLETPPILESITENIEQFEKIFNSK